MTDKSTVVSFLLDETGSMESIKDDTIGGFNQYLDTLATDHPGKIEFTLVKFDSNKIEKVCVGVPLEQVEKLSNHNYKPGAGTPLIDAAYKTITATRELVEKRDDRPNVTVVMQTDGHENASTEHTNDDLFALIKDLTAKGWMFMFLGAGIDAYDQAGKWGISQATTVSYARANTGQTMSAAARGTSAYAGTSDPLAAACTEEERKQMGETKTPDKPKTKIVDDLSLTE